MRRSNKSKKKMRRRMIIEEKKQEEKEVQIAVKDVEKELQNVVDKMAEHNISEEKEKYEFEIYPDHGKQYDFPFKFTMISKLGKQCYMGIRDTVVHTLDDYFDKEFRKLHGAQLTETLWWAHIFENFQRIFRDVIQGMMFLYLETDFGCDDGKGRILPSMVKRTMGTKETVDCIKQLKDAMRTVIAFPFNGITTNLELPLELRRFLDFEHSRCFSPPWFVINCPFFWTVEEKVQFVHELKMLIKLNAQTKWAIDTCLHNAGVFAFWKNVLDGVYKKVLDYHEPPTSKAEGAGDKSEHVKVQATIGYHDRVDICRFFVAAYSHVNDYMYKNDRGNKIFKRAEIEEALSTYFPYFYVNMFECLCLDANILGDEVLKMVSNLAWRF